MCSIRKDAFNNWLYNRCKKTLSSSTHVFQQDNRLIFQFWSCFKNWKMFFCSDGNCPLLYNNFHMWFLGWTIHIKTLYSTSHMEHKFFLAFYEMFLGSGMHLWDHHVFLRLQESKAKSVVQTNLCKHFFSFSLLILSYLHH